MCETIITCCVSLFRLTGSGLGGGWEGGSIIRAKEGGDILGFLGGRVGFYGVGV